MSSRLEEFDNLKIKMEDILSATNSFSRDKLIGSGGFGPVYKGKLSLSEGPTMVAFKRLDPTLGQGNAEFWKEIMMLSKYKHENLVSLLHFGIEGKERVLVYEYASRGSLDRYLGDPTLTWKQPLDICIGAVKALKYLHDPHDTQQRVLHRDIKSSNILLDEEWRAKVSDFGLSKIGPANQPQTFLVSDAVGTTVYCDPLYARTGLLSKESDVYSFGVVLFEVMCGTLCTQFYHNGMRILVDHWSKCCDENRVKDIIFKDIEEQMAPDSLKTFSTIANRCLMIDSTQRPTMEEIVKELEVAIEQNTIQDSELVMISKLAVSPVPYRSQKELISLFSKGILVDQGKRWVSINKNQEIIEMIAATECIDGEGLERYEDIKVRGARRGNPSRINLSRFSHTKKGSPLVSGDLTFIAQVRTRFLVPGITYTINLVFKHGIHDNPLRKLPFEYKLEGETHYSTTHIVKGINERWEKKDRWLSAELYQFTSYQKEHDFKIEIRVLRQKYHLTQYEGIMFQPMEHKTHENIEDKVRQQIPILHMGWRHKLLHFSKHIIPLSKNNVEWKTMEELYFILRKGLLIANGEVVPSYMWFHINKTMKLRYMLPAREILKEGKEGLWKFLPKFWKEEKECLWKSLPESRFEEVAESLDTDTLTFRFKITKIWKLWSRDKPFLCNFIYKLPENYSASQNRVVYYDNNKCTRPVSTYSYIAHHPPTPIIPSMVDVKPLRMPKVERHPKLRNDGWLELPLFLVSEENEEYHNYDVMDFKLIGYKHCKFPGLIIQGIEFIEL